MILIDWPLLGVDIGSLLGAGLAVHELLGDVLAWASAIAVDGPAIECATMRTGTLRCSASVSSASLLTVSPIARRTRSRSVFSVPS